MPPSQVLPPDSDKKEVYDPDSSRPITRPDLNGAGDKRANPKSERANNKYGEKAGDTGSSKTAADKATEAAGGMADRVGQGFSPEYAVASKTVKGVQKAKEFVLGEKNRKKSAITSIVVVAATVGIAAFISTLPNQTISLMSQLENHFFAGIEADLDQMSDRLVSDYIKHRILQRMGLQCKSSVNLKKCIAEGKARFNKVECADDDEVCKLFNSWDDSDLAGQFAGNGITFTEEDGRVFMNGDGLPDGKLDVTDFSKSDAENLFENKEVVSSGFVDTLHFVKNKLVVVVGSYLHNIFTKLFHGVIFDGDGLGSREEETDNISEEAKQGAEQATVEGEVVDDYTAETEAAMQCIADEECNPAQRTAGTTDAAADPVAGTPESSEEASADQALDEVSTKFGSEKLAGLLQNYNDLKTKGTDAMADALARAITGITGADVSKESIKVIADKFSVIGWIQMAASIVNFIHGADLKLKALNFSIHAAPFIAMFVAYASESDKQKSQCTNSTDGHCQNDFTMIGSFANALHANGSTASSSPFVQYATNPNTTTQTAASVHSNLMQNHLALNDYSNALTNASKGLNAIPGFNWLADLASLINKIINGVLAPINGLVARLFNVTGINDLIGKATGPLLIALSNNLFPMPNLTNLSGGNLGSILAIGNHLSASKAGMSLGGKRVSFKVASEIGDAQENYEFHQFQQRPLFARIFAADSPYSLVSKLSLDVPPSLSTMFTSLIDDPFGKVYSSFSTVVHPHFAYAAAAQDVSPDGVSDNLVPLNDSVFTTDSEAYQKQHNCVEQQKKDYPDWNKEVATDPDTGQVYHTQANGCLLMERTIESMGKVSGLGD